MKVPVGLGKILALGEILGLGEILEARSRPGRMITWTIAPVTNVTMSTINRINVKRRTPGG